MSWKPKEQPKALRMPTPIEQSATDWVARRDRGLTAAEQAEFDRWLGADPRHAELFEEFDGTLALFDRVGEISDAILPEVDELPANGSEPREPQAAQNDTPVPPVYSFPRVSRRRIFASGWITGSLAIAAAMAIAYIEWWRPRHFVGAASTEIGRMEEVRLPDGSTVQLNTDSSITAAFTPAARRVRLTRGEAHFSVAKNSARPFVVEANGIAVQAVGTAFNIRLRDAAVEVLVTKGKVRVREAAPGNSSSPMDADANGSGPSATVGLPELVAGQRLVTGGRSSRDDLSAQLAPAVIADVARDEMQRELAWQEGRLVFVTAQLADIVAEFNRYNRHKLVIVDSELSARRFGGSFKSDDPARFVRMLEANFPVVAERGQNETILKLAR